MNRCAVVYDYCVPGRNVSEDRTLIAGYLRPRPALFKTNGKLQIASKPQTLHAWFGSDRYVSDSGQNTFHRSQCCQKWKVVGCSSCTVPGITVLSRWWSIIHNLKIQVHSSPGHWIKQLKQGWPTALFHLMDISFKTVKHRWPGVHHCTPTLVETSYSILWHFCLLFRNTLRK